MPSVEELRFGLECLNLAVTAIVGIYVWQSHRHRVTAERITKLQSEIDGRLDDHADRLTRVEAAIEAAPSHADLGEMHEKVNQVATSLSRLEGVLKGVGDNVNMILSRIAERGMR